MPRFAANLTMMFHEVAFLDRFDAAAKAGFDAVEFLFPYDHPAAEIGDRLRRNGLTQALFNLPPGDWAAGERGLAAVPGRRHDVDAGLERAIPYIEATGVRRIHLMAGLAPRNASSDGAFCDAIRHCAGRLAPMGVDLVLEPINRRDMPGYYLSDFSWAAQLIGELALPNLKLQFDIYHCQILHGDVTMRLRQLMPIVGHVQIASIPSRNEPGTGELDDAFLFAELDRLGYNGFVGCEYRPRAATADGLAWFASYHRAPAMARA